MNFKTKLAEMGVTPKQFAKATGLTNRVVSTLDVWREGNTNYSKTTTKIRAAYPNEDWSFLEQPPHCVVDGCGLLLADSPGIGRRCRECSLAMARLRQQEYRRSKGQVPYAQALECSQCKAPLENNVGKGRQCVACFREYRRLHAQKSRRLAGVAARSIGAKKKRIPLNRVPTSDTTPVTIVGFTANWPKPKPGDWYQEMMAE